MAFMSGVALFRSQFRTIYWFTPLVDGHSYSADDKPWDPSEKAIR